MTRRSRLSLPWLWMLLQLINAVVIDTALYAAHRNHAFLRSGALRASSLAAPSNKVSCSGDQHPSISLICLRGGSDSNYQMREENDAQGQSSLESDDTMWTAPSDKRSGQKDSGGSGASTAPETSSQQDEDMEEDSGDEEFVDEEAVESEPIDMEQFKEEAREERLRRRQRFEEIVQRYNRTDVQEDLESDMSSGEVAEYLGLPTELPAPKSLHGTVMQDLAAYQNCALWDVSNVSCLEIGLDERPKIKIYPESLLSIQDALVTCKAGQVIVLKSGDHVLRSPLQARLVEHFGARPICLRGVQDPDFLKLGDAIDSLTGSNVYGRWSLETESQGEMKRLTCVYNEAKDPDLMFVQSVLESGKLSANSSARGFDDEQGVEADSTL
eukprot:100529-Hanusia_phi.AAC.1